MKIDAMIKNLLQQPESPSTASSVFEGSHEAAQMESKLARDGEQSAEKSEVRDTTGPGAAFAEEVVMADITAAAQSAKSGKSGRGKGKKIASLTPLVHVIEEDWSFPR